MRFEISYQPALWAVIPELGDDELDEHWVAEQADAYAVGPMSAAVERSVLRAVGGAAAREALSYRRAEVETSLFFRPVTDPMFGVMHFLVQQEPEGIDDVEPADWLAPGMELLIDPVVAEFETDHIPHGYRMAYATTQSFDDGVQKTGVSWGFRLDGKLGLVFSELARADVAGLMLAGCDPIVGSLRLVP